jgi:hypothetical protein
MNNYKSMKMEVVEPIEEFQLIEVLDRMSTTECRFCDFLVELNGIEED